MEAKIRDKKQREINTTKLNNGGLLRLIERVGD